MKKIILISLLLLVNIIFAQENNSNTKTKEIKDSLELKTVNNNLNKYNPREKRRLGVNGVIGGQSVILSLSLDYFVTPNINIEAGGGMIGGYVGMKYHIDGIMNDVRWHPYFGASFAVVESFSFGGETRLENFLYIPFGFQYIGNKGFSIAGEVARLTPNSWTTAWGAIRIGYHFKL